MEKIRCTNPCVVEGTLVNTPDGLRRVETIKEGDLLATLHGRGHELLTSIEMHDNVELFTVKFSDGGIQTVTVAHVYHVVGRNKYLPNKVWKCQNAI